MPERPSLSYEKVIRAAIDYVDEFGIDALSTRSLGQVLGAHHTAIYRHFHNKAELILAMFDFIINEVSESLTSAPSDPRGRIRTVALAFREALHAHPALVSAVITTNSSPRSFELQKLIINSLREIGVSEKDLAFRYQALESYVFGSSLFDFTGAPEHLSSRRSRFTESGIPNLLVHVTSDESIDAFNEKAFIVGLELRLA